MFYNYNKSLNYITKGTNIPSEYKQCIYTSPTLSIAGKKSGATVVTQYLNCLIFKYIGNNMCSNDIIDNIYSKAIEIDNKNYNNTSDYPSLLGCMNACLQLGYMTNASVKFIKDVETLKNMIYNYDQVILQTKITDTIFNSTAFLISDSGNIEYEDYTKGFIAYGYDSEGLLVQNTRGLGIGCAGFQKIKWSVLTSIFINGCLFDDD